MNMLINLIVAIIFNVYIYQNILSTLDTYIFIYQLYFNKAEVKHQYLHYLLVRDWKTAP